MLERCCLLRPNRTVIAPTIPMLRSPLPRLSNPLFLRQGFHNLMTTRREHDLIGDRDVPAHAYYGIHTLRAVENFRISGTPISIYPELIRSSPDWNENGLQISLLQPRVL